MPRQSLQAWLFTVPLPWLTHHLPRCRFNADTVVDSNTSDKTIHTTKIDIIPCQSGSPAWELRSNDGGRYIKAVVSHHSCPTSSLSSDNRTCSSTASGYNGLVQLDSQHFNNILAWR